MLMKTKQGGEIMNSDKKIKHRPYNKFRGCLVEKKITYADIARTLDISETSVGQKINGVSDFYLTEVKKIKNAYGIEPYIFFTA